MDDWARKYMVIAGSAAPKAPEPKDEPPSKKPEPVSEPVPETPAPAVEDPPKKTPRKRSVKKDLNEAAEKPKKLPVKRAATKRKPTTRKAE